MTRMMEMRMEKKTNRKEMMKMKTMMDDISVRDMYMFFYVLISVASIP